MNRIYIALATLALAALACSFGAQRPPTPTFAPPPTQQPALVVIDAREPTNAAPAPTATPRPPISSGSNNNGGTGTLPCAVRTDWVLYSVVAGDTLGRLALRTNSTVNQLATGNCLANPNSISVGQTLRLPRAPLPPTVPPTDTSYISTYSDSANGFAFDYPTSFRLEASGNLLVMRTPEGVFQMEVANPVYVEGYTLDEWIDEALSSGAGGADLTVISRQDMILVSGVPVVRLHVRANNYDEFIRYWAIIKGRYMIITSATNFNFGLTDQVVNSLRQI